MSNFKMLSEHKPIDNVGNIHTIKEKREKIVDGKYLYHLGQVVVFDYTS